MKILLLLLLLGFSGEVWAQESFKMADNLRSTPSDYLEKLKVKDTSRKLSEQEKHEICRLFIKAYAVSVRKHKMGNFITTRAPIYRLLVTNFPDLSSREGEGGSIIFLGAIAGYFNRMPEYREDVLQVLRQGIDRKYCGR